MNLAQEKTLLKDYTAYPFEITSVHLTFKLHPNKTRVLARLNVKRCGSQAENMFLNGDKLKLIACRLDGASIDPELSEKGLLIKSAKPAFILETEVEIDPASNTALDGLYMSNGVYCTQCEAEGFRKITFYPDRPDVMSIFHVRIEDPTQTLPVLLSNGNSVAQGPGWAEWSDPWPKPSYLFALVAGDLKRHCGHFTTKSGRAVDLGIYVRNGDEDKCEFAMDSLIKSMTWDEDVYGREYDLDVFNIVAIDDFNAGAMENKGLNIFNSSYVLANPKTTMDGGFERIEGIIAHEYFHNWTGNRITCRDWFQLSLKEGLTVFRDAQFTSDMRSAAVKRIEDVIALRHRQFPEDAGALAHPVRPESYVAIDNFYTATVYDKGAEVIGMLKRLVGDVAYEEALTLYFERHDGEAATIEDWLKVFEDVTGRDLSQFKGWYTQSGTPRVSVEEAFEDGTYTLTFAQSTSPTPDQTDKVAQVIPINVGLLNDNGDEILPTTLLEMTKDRQSFEFKGLASRPTASILRGFSAPVHLDQPLTDQKRAFLMIHDTDPFTRWEASNALQTKALIDMALTDAPANFALIDAMASIISDETIDPAFRALVLSLPNESELARQMTSEGLTVDPQKLYLARQAFSNALAERLYDLLKTLYERHMVTAPYQPDAEQSAARKLTNAALSYVSFKDGGALARAQFQRADNMTLQASALASLLRQGRASGELEAFYDHWKDERLVIDRWFLLQIATASPDTLVPIAQNLTKHAEFSIRNPNRFRSVIVAFTQNFAGFHQSSGAGYHFVADWLIQSDALNPTLSARLSGAFQEGPFNEEGKNHLIAALNRLNEKASKNTTEMVSRILLNLE